jgi:phosphoenolpyruvate synthase/pyruvate phosphate dikinase
MFRLFSCSSFIHLKVAAGFVITAAAFKRFMDYNSLQAITYGMRTRASGTRMS